jgi:hypothetical protein
VPARFKNLTWYFSVWLKAAVGTPAIFIAITDGVSETLQNCNLTTTWQRFVANRTISGNATWFRISVGGANSWPEADGPIDMWGAAVYCPTLDARLHKILIEAASDANGKAALDIWPRLRESPPDFSALVLTDAKGTFRLREPPGWTLDEMLHYGISFKAMEAF